MGTPLCICHDYSLVAGVDCGVAFMAFMNFGLILYVLSHCNPIYPTL